MKNTQGKPAKVNNVHSHPVAAVIVELEDLLERARLGDVIGIGYTYVSRRQVVRAGLAGTLARDKWKATGAFFAAAMSVAQKDDPYE